MTNSHLSNDLTGLKTPSGVETGKAALASARSSFVRNPNDLLYGLTLFGIGLLGLWLAWPLKIGTALRMGPGWMPTAMCYLLFLLGAAMVISSVRGHQVALERWAPRPIVFVLAAIAVFSVGIKALGLPMTVLMIVALSAFADRDSRPRETVVLALALAVAASLVFIGALGLPLPLWPRFV